MTPRRLLSDFCHDKLLTDSLEASTTTKIIIPALFEPVSLLFPTLRLGIYTTHSLTISP